MRAQFVIPVLASILILGVLGLSQNAYAQENTVIDSIPLIVFNQPVFVAVNEQTERAYVTHIGSNIVTVIDTSTNTVVDTITVGSAPVGVAVNESNDRAYVVNQNSRTVSVIDTLNDANTIIATIPVGLAPQHIAVNELTDRAYVANLFSNTVSVINTLNDANTVIATIPVGSRPVGVAVNELTDRAYVANQSSRTVSVIDTLNDANTIIATIPVGSVQQYITVNELTDRVYSTNGGSNTVSVINTLNDANTVIATIPVGSGPIGVAVNELTDRAYVPNLFSNTVSVIDTLNDANTVIATITVSRAPFGIAVNDLTHRAYVVNAGSVGFGIPPTVSVIDIEPVPPETSIDSAVDGNGAARTNGDTINNDSLTFTFSGTDDVAVASFECSLDGAAFSACSSPINFGGVTSIIILALGSHTFEVRAIDTSANVDPSPASFTWNIIDNTPPETSIDSAVDGNGAARTNGDTVINDSLTFTFSGTDDFAVASFECSLDGAAFSVCSSPINFGGLALGSHTFEVRAIDTSANVDPIPASFTWAVQTTEEALSDLISEIDGFELSKPSEKSLTQKLNAAIKFLTDKNENNDLNSCNKLNDFVKLVNAQDGKGLTTPQADSLRDSAQEIKTSIGCT